jgi:hypothetical protein
LTSAEITALFEQEARQRVSYLLSSGQAVYSSGTGQDTHHLIMHTADGHRVQYAVAPDGRRTLSDHDVA